MCRMARLVWAEIHSRICTWSSDLAGDLDWNACLLRLACNALRPALRPKNLSARSSVAFPVTVSTECDQIVHRIATQLAPSFHVMDMKVLHRTALLASPSITFEHLLSQYCVLGHDRLFKNRFKKACERCCKRRRRSVERCCRQWCEGVLG